MTPGELREILDPALRRARYEAWKASQIEPCWFAGEGPCQGPLGNVRPMTDYGDEPGHYRMCERHAAEYTEHWSAMWQEYYRGLL